ncbi:LysR substrate-binding domain-containing protein [Thalassobaculum sp.]|uniref:LysR family transcriptional regulator n=1 Tax=Thalassobaculum sp. TaxID=2022740 RepID=UPI0032EBBECE
MSLSLRQMEVFRAVMISSSHAAAARMLKVSQPSISRMLSTAEERLGIQLFERVGRRLKPTPEAERLIIAIDDVYKQVQRANDIARDLLLQRSGGLRVVASASVGHYVIPNTIKALHDRIPDIQLEIEVQTASELVKNVANGHAEVGVVNLNADHPGLEGTRIYDARLMCIFPVDHPLARKATIRIEDAVEHHMITYEPDTPYGMLVEGFLSQARTPLISNIRVRTSQMACSLVEAGAGIAFADELAVHGSVSSTVTARPVEPYQSVPVSYLSVRGQPISTTAKLFIELLGVELKSIAAALSDEGAVTRTNG